MTVIGLGWGSLVWNPGVLRCKGGWREDGPALPLEFARTSRDGKLTLVLVDGARPVPTLWTELDYRSPDEAQAALAGREGCPLMSIGRWPGFSRGHDDGTRAIIAAWAARREIHAALWTALPPKFEDQAGRVPESAQQAIEYLRSRDPDTLAKCREYIERAPVQVTTTFRAAIEEAMGWGTRDRAPA